MSKYFLFLLLICSETFVFSQFQNKQLFEEVKRYENGKIKTIIGLNEYDKREGITYEYFPNGLLFRETSYVNDKKEGMEITYFPNSVIESRGLFINDLAEGVFQYFYKNGKPFATLVFQNNLLVTAKDCYTSKGEIVYCGPINNGNGVFLKYDKKGNLISKDYYKNGVFQRSEHVEVNLKK
ncbi:hypothetical protein OBK22_10725 [Empedobacter falsenii]|uniref:toxin-antitoxin system YwqK family antitoxin n=1 Tax=Empedobacter stercoris TaxID=1628248 RepID=UPI001CE09A1D|nr:hypothetical protein [Empedobacter stercoris]MCA4777638.1 hypothetical protein [Empedobacter stercoris]MCA4783058.1 hypothetical protein [Empedobacter stercoris]